MGVERRKVFIIFNGDKYTKELILEELENEQFVHQFKLACDLESMEYKDYINDADEVWTFGDVSNYIQYVYAVSEGKEIWEMG